MTGLLRLLRCIVILALTLGVALGVAAFALAWRLSAGPMDLGWALPRVEAALNRPGAVSRVGVSAATLAWPGVFDGTGQGITLTLRDLTLREGDRMVAKAATLAVSLAPASLVRLDPHPHVIEAAGLELNLLRAADGAVTADFGSADLGAASDAPAPDLVEAVRELARPPRAVGTRPIRSELQQLQQLQRIRLSDSVLTLQDRGLGSLWRLDVANLALARQPQGGVLGEAAATLALGATRAGLVLHAELVPEGGTSLKLVLAPVGTASMQRAAESQGAELGPANLLDTALGGTASLLLDSALRPRSGTLQLSAGGGRVMVAGTPIGFDSLDLVAATRWAEPAWARPTALTLSRLKAVVHAPGGGWPSTLIVAGELTRGGERLNGTVTAAVDHVGFTDLVRLWPERLGGHVRPWMAKSISAGTARDATATMEFTSGSSLADPVLTRIDGSVVGDDATIHWLRPVPPVERAQALLTIRSPDVLDIAVSGGRQGGVALTNGSIHITGLNVKDQFLTLNADAAGPVAEVIQLLRHPRLQLLDRKPIPMRNPGGSFAGHLSVFLPLNEDLSFDDVKIGAKVRATDLRLGGLVAGRDLDRGDVQLEATSDVLKAQGRAAISGIPADLVVDMDFRNGGPAQLVQRAQATARTGPQQLAAAGLDTAGIIDFGQGVFTARYAQRRDGTAELGIAANLRDAALSLPGWTKPVGQPADASARLLLRNDQVLGLDQLHAQGPGLAVDGRVDLVGDRPLLLRFDQLVLGRTQGSGEVQLPAGPGSPIVARLQGRVLDLSTILARRPGRTAAVAEPRWQADVRFDQVLLAGDRGLAGVTAHAESEAGRVWSLRAVSTGPERLDATIQRVNGVRSLAVKSADGGAVLRAMDLLDSVQGGAMDLRAAYDDSRAEPPLRGTLELSGFRVRGAPGLGKLLQAVTVYGVIEALSGPGLSFVALNMPFSWDGTVLEMTDVQAFSASLGLTARGRVDAARKTIDMQGTVVPLYVINSMLGRIPLLGRLFSAEKGGGLLAVNYTLRGAAADPTVSVNPLSALTPGFLRGLFKILD